MTACEVDEQQILGSEAVAATSSTKGASLPHEASVFSTPKGHASVIGTNGKTIYPSKVGFAVSDQPIRERREERRRGKQGTGLQAIGLSPMGVFRKPRRHYLPV